MIKKTNKTLTPREVYNILLKLIDDFKSFGEGVIVDINSSIKDNTLYVSLSNNIMLFFEISDRGRIKSLSSCVVFNPLKGPGSFDLYHRDSENSGIDGSDRVFNLLTNNKKLETLIALLEFYEGIFESRRVEEKLKEDSKKLESILHG